MSGKYLLLALLVAAPVASAGPCEDQDKYCGGSEPNATLCEVATAKCTGSGQMRRKARAAAEQGGDSANDNAALQSGLRDLPKEQADTIRRTLEQIPGGLELLR